MYGHTYDKRLVVDLAPERRRTSLLRRLYIALGEAHDRLLAWQERARSRRLLRGLNDHMLRDIGIDRGVAEEEGSTPFWR